MTQPRFVPAPRIDNRSDEELLRRAREFYETMRERRTFRDYSDRPVPREVIEYCLRAAGTAPSGANLQPWHFVAVSDPAIKREIRVAAQSEEKEFYAKRAPKAWLEALAPLGTDSNKPFLEIAPWLIAVFAQPFRILPDGARSPTYYAIESVGIATGILITALHSSGLVALTHTPSPMGFLNKILGRPSHEKPFVLLVVGHPADDALVPDIARKPLTDISSFVTGTKV
ncbi:MAG: nitroreductase family protein [Chthoniobacterales bacterium]|nr:MAG: nitroreductase family protein [Chthoniobacterales bacterium]